MYLIRLIILCNCLLFFAYSNSVACTKDDNDHAIDLVIQGKNDESLAFISAKLKECPNDIDLRKGRVTLLYGKKMYRAAQEDNEYLLKIDPLNEDYLMVRCILSESIAPENTKDFHLACYKNLSEIIKAKNKGKPLLETEDAASYVAAVSMAELPEAEEIRRQYLKFLDTSGKDQFYIDFERNIFLHFDRKKLLLPR